MLAAVLSLSGGNAHADAEYSPDDFGGIGLLQMPSARFAADGSFSAGISTVAPYDQLLLGLQWFPWLETNLRYTQVTNRLYGPESFSGQQSYKDRGTDLKLLLIGEGEHWPQVALGLRDVGGTGLFASEYLVASRRYYDFDFTLGMGWGRMGSRGGIRNPMSLFSSHFDVRPGDDSTPGGAGIDRLFTGSDVGIFGGLQWQSSIRGLGVKLEYDGNDYRSEALDNDQKVGLPLNVAVYYQPKSSYDLSMGIERGNTLMARLSVLTNFHTNRGPDKVLDPPPTPRLPAQGADESHAIRPAARLDDGFITQLRKELVRQRISLQALDVDDDKGVLTIWYAQSLTRSQQRAVGRVAQTLAAMAPEHYEAFTLVNVYGDIETFRVTVLREDINAALRFRTSPEELAARILVDAPKSTGLKNSLFREPVDYPQFNWGMGPALRQHVGGPEGFYFGQLWWRTSAILDLTSHWSFSGSVGVNIYNNFDGLRVPSNSALPHVRSDIKEYLQEGQNNLVRLETNYIWSPAENWHARLSGGIFEEMYGGVAGELLYRPAYGPWAVGADINRVRKRAYDQQFDFLDYEVTTGHLTGYFELPFYNLLLKLSVGRYLAGDQGGTIELSRQFASGVRVGAFATKTNVSAEDFGEGQFDKGVMIYLPMDLFFPKSSRRGVGLAFRPLTRDGGQKVRDGVELYGVTESGHLGEPTSWDELLQ